MYRPDMWKTRNVVILLNEADVNTLTQRLRYKMGTKSRPFKRTNSRPFKT